MRSNSSTCVTYSAGLLVLLGIAGLAAGPASQPGAAGAGPGKVLANGAIRITAPDGWDELPAAATELRAAYSLHDHPSILSVEVLPADATIGHESANAIMRVLRQTHQQRKEQFVLNPTVEKDGRFLLRIHEKFHTTVKVDDQPTPKVADQLHLYVQAGPRVVMVTVWSTAESDDELKEAASVGESTALSAVFQRPRRGNAER